jgi:anaerobic magnesium-protoporphyrin IX monomethyl ester cyclase
MKIYLLNPHVPGEDKYIREGRCMQKASSWVTIWPPVGLATLAVLARQKGEVRLNDGNVEEMPMEALRQDVAAFDPDLVVVSTGFPSIDVDMGAMQKIGEVCPRAKLLAFGVYFTLLEQIGFEQYPWLDFALVGEPEETFTELLEALDAGRQDYGTIQGLLYRDSSGVQITPRRKLIEDIDTIPFPDRSLLPTNRYTLPHNGKPFTLINSARGCPHECIYCTVSPYYGRRVRRHSIEYVIAEIKECVNKHQIDELLFWEEVFTLDKQRVLDLCAAIRREGLHIHWAATTRVDRVDEEILQAMKAAGCYLLGLGIESGEQRILDTAKKKTTVEQSRRAVSLCRRAGIATMGHFIFGLPGETRETARRTIRFLSKLGLNYMQSYCAVPYPKTELGELARKNHWIRAQRWSEYDFGGDSIMETDALTPAEVTHFRKKAFRAFYVRPSVVARTLAEMGLRRSLRSLTFLKWMNSRK